jgi:hypothetical protein
VRALVADDDVSTLTAPPEKKKRKIMVGSKTAESKTLIFHIKLL